MSQADEEKETARVEAFSDGVFAIAITLLVLELKVPHNLREDGTLIAALLQQWPSYVAFLVSFMTILIMWLNHHRLFSLIHKTDERLLLLNGVLLMFITIVPFPTALLAEYFRASSGRTAALVYSAHGFNISLAYNLLLHHAIRKEGHLLRKDVDLKRVQAISRQYRLGPLLYLTSFSIAFASVTACVAVNAALAMFFARPPPSMKKTPPPAARPP